ncbi:Hypothetical protein PACV_390 [Pacmanvirus A23]|uniref:Hypothetical protein n=1 Tax=Pacmanvirus A23 TaxID=1932881 RepID=UPI000A09361E|nr:Hypothetical protein B9W72_gp386 [Pacmanvirus A23]SIP86103.1 Hypothetical protein PACV_390 [Pacmanvirus A23]
METNLGSLKKLASIDPVKLDKLLKLLESDEPKTEPTEYDKDIKIFDELNTKLDGYISFQDYSCIYSGWGIKKPEYRPPREFIEHALKCNEIVKKYSDRKFYAIVDYRFGSEIWIYPIAYYAEENFPYDIKKLSWAQKFIGIEKTATKYIKKPTIYSHIFYRYEEHERKYGNYMKIIPNLTIFDSEVLAFGQME